MDVSLPLIKMTHYLIYVGIIVWNLRRFQHLISYRDGAHCLVIWIPITTLYSAAILAYHVVGTRHA